MQRKLYGENITFSEAIQQASAIGIDREEKSPEYRYELLRVHLKNGDYIDFESEYQGPYSEVTPGEGIQPPTCTYYTTKEMT